MKGDSGELVRTTEAREGTFLGPVSRAHAMEHINWDQLDKRKYFTIGPSCFFAVRFCLYPPSLVKTRLQLQNTVVSSGKGLDSVVYKGTYDAFRKIVKYEGARSLWKGFVPKSFGLVAGSAYVGTYEFLRNKFVMLGWAQSSADMVAGGLASLVSQVIVVPTDVVSQCMAVLKNPNPNIEERTLKGQVKKIYVERGSTVRGFYRGFGASIMTYMPTSAIWWTSYGIYKRKLIDRVPGHGVLADDYYRQLFCQSVSGGIAGATAGFITNPMDVIKVRKQLSPRYLSYKNIVKELLAEAGPRAFLKGMTARVLSMAPSGLVTVSVYEFIKRASRKE